MARLTIEQKWWIDPRRTFLNSLVKDNDAVNGLMLQVWRIAQEYWGQNQLIPWRVFSKFPHHRAIVESDLAEMRNSAELASTTIYEFPNTPEQASNTFVYVRGAKELFTWLFEIREKRKLGGRVSAQRSRDEKGRLLPNGHRIPDNYPPTTQLDSKTRPSEPSTIQLESKTRPSEPSTIQLESKTRPSEPSTT